MAERDTGEDLGSNESFGSTESAGSGDPADPTTIEPDSGEPLPSKWKASELIAYLDKHHEFFEDSETSILNTPCPAGTPGNGVVARRIEQGIVNLIRKTVISGEPTLYESGHSCGTASALPRTAFGIYGFDIMLLQDGSLRLIEVNASPATGTSSRLDSEVKYAMLADALNTVGLSVDFVGQRHRPATRSSARPATGRRPHTASASPRFDDGGDQSDNSSSANSTNSTNSAASVGSVGSASGADSADSEVSTILGKHPRVCIPSVLSPDEKRDRDAARRALRPPTRPTTIRTLSSALRARRDRPTSASDGVSLSCAGGLPTTLPPRFPSSETPTVSLVSGEPKETDDGETAPNPPRISRPQAQLTEQNAQQGLQPSPRASARPSPRATPRASPRLPFDEIPFTTDWMSSSVDKIQKIDREGHRTFSLPPGHLTDSEKRILAQLVDEEARSGGFVRVFPDAAADDYLNLFREDRYATVLAMAFLTAGSPRSVFD